MPYERLFSIVQNYKSLYNTFYYDFNRLGKKTEQIIKHNQQLAFKSV
jgi:hypothetical protein